MVCGPLVSSSEGNELLDTHAVMALPIVVALAVDPTTQPSLRKDLFIDFALTLQFNLGSYMLLGFGSGEMSLQGVFPRASMRHVHFLYDGYSVALQSPEKTKAHPLAGGGGLSSELYEQQTASTWVSHSLPCRNNNTRNNSNNMRNTEWK
jgi:hypothetical protein